MNVVTHPVSTDFYIDTTLTRRAIAGVILHDTEGDTLVDPYENASWHYEIDRAGTIHAYVPEPDVAFCVRATDRWHPPWMPKTRPWDASPANCWCLNIEIVSSQKYRTQGRPYTNAQIAAVQALLLDIRSRYGALPLVGHGHLQTDRSDPAWFSWETVLPVLPEVDKWMPLEGASRSDPLEGGYGFAEWTGVAFHPATDLNAGPGGDSDLGAPVRTPMGGIVRFVGFDFVGYGNHLWLESDTGHWLHFCHLQLPPFAAVGSRLERGARFGYCGKSGGWPWAHVHWEVAYTKPASWSQWVTGWSKDRVLNTYMDPFAYLAATWPEGTENGTPMETPVLNDAELTWKVQAPLWGEFWEPAAADFGIPVRWRYEYRLGNQLGRPRGPEQDVPDVPGARMQEFERGIITYKDGRTTLCG